MTNTSLPQLSGDIFLTDGGLETSLIFLQGQDLPAFAAFPLLETEEGRKELDAYFRPYLEAARAHGVGFVLDTPTWRANTEWAEGLGYSAEAIAGINRKAVAWAKSLAGEFESEGVEIVVNGAIGPRGDGYTPESFMTAEEARDYHMPQIRAFAEASAEMVTAVTMNYSNEGAGIALAAKECGIPAVISFTTETNGKLFSGETIGEAVEAVDRITGGSPAYFMINCAHPTHFDFALQDGAAWLDRIRGLRANASTMSHAELDEAEELDAGDPHDLGQRYAALRGKARNLNVLGGCCGTDHRHVGAIADAVIAG